MLSFWQNKVLVSNQDVIFMSYAEKVTKKQERQQGAGAMGAG
jgi:hypothetical protein